MEITLRHHVVAGFALAAFLLVVPLQAAGEVVEPEEASPRPRSVERPRLELRSSDGDSSIRFQLAAQFRYSWETLDQGGGQDRVENDLLELRRIRPVISGSLITEALTYRLHINLVPGKIELMDLWLNFAFHTHAQLLVGVNKVPFTRYRLNSFSDLPLVEWSNETIWYGAERQYGVILHNGMDSPQRWEYQLGVFTGINARASNAIGMSRAFGETPPNPSDLDSPSEPGNPRIHPEIVAHLGYNTPEMNVRRPTDLEGGPFRYSFGLSGAWDVRPVPTQDWAVRLAPEMLFKFYGAMFQSVFYLTLWDAVVPGEGIGLATIGALFQTSYVIRGRVEVALRYTLIHLTDGLREDARARADGLIAEADPEEVDALTQQYRSVGRVVREHELNLGVNVYVYGTAFKVQLDGGLLGHERVDETRWDVRLRLQAQFAF